MEPQYLLELAQKMGAQAAEVYVSRGQEESVNFEANRLKQLESALTEGYALTVWQGDQAGVSVMHGEPDPELLVETALRALKVAPSRDVPRNRNTQINQQMIALPLTTTELRQIGEALIQATRTDFPQLLCHAGVSQNVSEVWLVNSEGLDCRYQTSSRSASLVLEWIRGDDFLQVYDGQTVREEPLDQAGIVSRCLERVRWAQETALARTGTFPVLFTDRAVSLLFEPVFSALSGRLVSQKASPWSQSLGEMVLHPTLTLRQDPTIGMGALPFDDEGTPTQAVTFVQAGALQMFYADLNTAKALGITPTGNGFRGSLGSFASPGLINMLLPTGTTTFMEMVQSLEEGLIVDQVMGNSAGLSGDFSVNVELGYWVKRGEIVGRVKDTMIAGNCYPLLQSELILSQEASWQGDLYTPHLLLPKVAVTD